MKVTEATTKELLAFYNEHAEKPVKKFADRKTAERRVNALIESLPSTDESQAAKRSAAISKSWQDKDVHAKRSQRSGVEVDGVQYRSVKQAFEKLGLPLNEHISFRMLLKATGKQKCYDRQWKIVPLNYK